MANDKGVSLMQPIMQYGFAGLTIILLGIVVWMIDCNNRDRMNAAEVIKETNQVIERNTGAIQELSRIVHDKL